MGAHLRVHVFHGTIMIHQRRQLTIACTCCWYATAPCLHIAADSVLLEATCSSCANVLLGEKACNSGLHLCFCLDTLSAGLIAYLRLAAMCHVQTFGSGVLCAP